MLAFSAEARIFVCQEPVDLRKGFEGLLSMIEQIFQEGVVAGAYFAFLNRRKDRMKLIYWDGDGLVIWYKRLEKGSFSQGNKGQILLNRKEFFMLLEGITPKRLQARYNIT